MDANVIKELQNGLNAAYINGSVAVNLAYKPAFVSNNPEDGKKVISSVEDELLRCDQFQISVAFITMGGVTPLLQTWTKQQNMFVQGTRLVDFTVVQERFTKMLPVGSRILDFGCGSG